MDLNSVNSSHLAYIVEQYYDKYSYAFVEYHLGNLEEDCCAEITKSRIYSCRKRLKSKQNRKLSIEFVKYIVKFKKPTLFEKLTTCPQFHICKGFDFRPLVRELKMLPNISDYSEALRDRDKINKENQKLRHEYYEQYEQWCKENNQPCRMDEVPDIYSFYFNDCWNTWKGGSYKRDFYLYIENSKIQNKDENIKIKEDFKLKMKRLKEEMKLNSINHNNAETNDA